MPEKCKHCEELRKLKTFMGTLIAMSNKSEEEIISWYHTREHQVFGGS